MENSDPVELWILYSIEDVKGWFLPDEWNGQMFLAGYRYDFYWSLSELRKLQWDMLQKLVRTERNLWNAVYGFPRQYRLVAEKCQMFFYQSPLQRELHLSRKRRRRGRGHPSDYPPIPLPLGQVHRRIPYLFWYPPYPARPRLEIRVNWVLRVEPVQCRTQVFFDFFDALLFRRNPPPRSNRHRKRMAKRRFRRHCELIKALQNTSLKPQLILDPFPARSSLD